MNVERVMPVATEVANGLPLRWRWTGKGPARDSPITLTRPGGSRVDTLRFDARGFAELSVPPGNYRYSLGGGEESGLVAVEQYSDEWRPAPVVLRSQPGETAQQRESVPLRERWWLFALAIAAFAAEWTWRRRIGLP